MPSPAFLPPHSRLELPPATTAQPTQLRLLASLVDSAPEALFAVGLDGRILSWNQGAQRIFGWTPQEIVGQGVTVLVPPERLAELELRNAIYAGGEVRQFETVRLRKDGTRVPVALSFSPLTDDDGELLGCSTVVSDITDRKREEEARRATEEQLRAWLSLVEATLESTTDGLLVVNTQGRIVAHNRQFAEMWGLPGEVLESRDDDRAIAHVLAQLVDPQAFVQKVREVYASPDATSFDVLEFRDGRVFERYSKAQRIGDQAVGRVWSFRDVTERRRAEQERLASVEARRELERLRELDRFKTQFLNTAAHELNTPLTPILLQLDLLRLDGTLSEPQGRAVATLERNVERLGTLVRDLLEAARLQAGRLEPRLAPLDLRHAVLEATDAFAPAAAREGIALEVRASDPLHVHADHQRLLQVLYNLLSNAVKFTPRGGRVTVEAVAEGGSAVVRVQDTGIGLRQEDLPRLFQPFAQLHDKAGARGSGLGLHLCKGLMTAHGGTVEASSPGLNQGATFTVKLPLDPQAADAAWKA